MSKSTSLRLDGAICGKIWMPSVMGGIPINIDLGRECERFASKPESMREVLLHILAEKGGDFQNAAFSDDSLIIVQRTWQAGAVKHNQARYVRVADWKGCADLTHKDAYTCDFIEEY